MFNSTKFQLHWCAPLLMLAISMQTQAAQTPGENVEAQDSSCKSTPSFLDRQLQRLSNQYMGCRTSRQEELQSLERKRELARQLVTAADGVDLSSEFSDLVKRIRARDIWFEQKFGEFEHCVQDLTVLPQQKSNNGGTSSCSEEKQFTFRSIDKLKSLVLACEKCNVGNIGIGYTKSLAELLALQEKDVNKLKRFLEDQKIYVDKDAKITAQKE